MIINWINCMLEFSSFIILFIIFSNFYAKRKEIIIYLLLCGITSVFITLFNPPLVLSILFFTLIPTISFKLRFSENIVFLSVSMMLIIYIEFMLSTLIPHSLLQTNLGNTIVVLIIFFFLLILFFLSAKYKVQHLLPSFILAHKILILSILFFTCLLGQFYLSRLSIFWAYLPGLISVFLFVLSLISLLLYIHYAQSADRLQIQLLSKNIDNIETYVSSLRIQNHDFKHHLRYFQNQVNTALSLSELKEELNSYIKNMEKDRTWLDAILNINQPVFRAVLYGCYIKCEQENIDYKFATTDYLPNFPLKDYQLVEILENLISNAVEQNLVLPISQRKLSITFFADSESNEIKIKNPVNDATIPLEEMLKTGATNKDSFTHQGLGLSSIQQLCRKNNIIFSGERSKNSVTFSIIYKENK